MKCKNCNSTIVEGICPGCGKTVEELRSLGQIEEASAEVETFSMEPQKKPKKSKIPILLCLTLVLVIAAGGVLVWNYLQNYPKIVFETFVKRTMDYTKQNITSTNFDTMTTNFDIKFDIDFKEEELLEPVADMLNNFAINGRFQIDMNKNLALLNIDTTYSKSELINTSIFYKNSKIYLLLKDLYKNYISIDTSELEKTLRETENINPEELQYLINTTLSTISESFKNEYFTRTFEGDLSKITLNLTEKNVSEISLSLLNKIKDDEKYLDALSKISQTDKEQLKEEIETAINDSQKKSSKKVEGSIAIYTKKNSKDVIKVEIEDKVDKIKISVKKESNDKYLITYTVSGVTSEISLESSRDGDKTKYKVGISSSEGEFNCEVTTSVKYNEPFAEPNDIKDSIDYTELTEQDMTEISNNLLTKKGAQKFAADMMKLITLLGFDSGTDSMITPDLDF